MSMIESVSAGAARTLAKALASELRKKPLPVELAFPETGVRPPAEQPAVEPQSAYGRVARETDDGHAETAYLDGAGRLRWVPVTSDAPPASWLPLYELLETGQ